MRRSCGAREEGVALDREGFALDREGFALDREGFALDREGFALDRGALRSAAGAEIIELLGIGPEPAQVSFSRNEPILAAREALGPAREAPRSSAKLYAL